VILYSHHLYAFVQQSIPVHYFCTTLARYPKMIYDMFNRIIHTSDDENEVDSTSDDSSMSEATHDETTEDETEEDDEMSEQSSHPAFMSCNPREGCNCSACEKGRAGLLRPRSAAKQDRQAIQPATPPSPLRRSRTVHPGHVNAKQAGKTLGPAVVRHKEIAKKETLVKERLRHEADMVGKTKGQRLSGEAVASRKPQVAVPGFKEIPPTPAAVGQGHKRRFSVLETEVIGLLARLAEEHRNV